MFAYFHSLIDPFKKHDSLKPPKTLAAFYWHYARQIWPILLLMVFLNTLYAFTEVVILTFLGKLIDLIQKAASPETFFDQHSGTLLFMAFIILMVQPVVNLLTELVEDNSFHINFSTLVRWQTHQYVKQQSLSFFQNDFAGRIASKVQTTGGKLRQSVRQILAAFVYTITFWLSTFVVFASLNFWLALPLLLWFAAYAALLYHFIPKISKASQKIADAVSTYNGYLIDNYSNISTVKLFAGSQQEDSRIRDSLHRSNAIGNRLMQINTLMRFILGMLNNILLVVTISLTLWLWQQSLITLGGIALSLPLVMRIIDHSSWIMGMVQNLFENIGQVEDGMKTIAKDQTLTDIPNAAVLNTQRTDRSITFQNIGFHYAGSQSVLDDISLSIKAGEKVGLIGASGAGKSTLIHLLLRFYDLQSGKILIGGQNIAHVTQDSLRRAIAMVSQDTSLLHRSIADNLRYGKPNASQQDMINAAKQAQAHEFIMGLSDKDGNKGYDAVVGERGVKLSGGQRQRIAIARVLLKDAPILILDEATSALDSEVEAAIQQQLDKLISDKTVIAIAHRLSTIAQMDRLIVLDKGKIVEQGTHEELLSQNGIYAALWSRQSGGFIAG